MSLFFTVNANAQTLGKFFDWSNGRLSAPVGDWSKDTALPGYSAIPFLWHWEPMAIDGSGEYVPSVPIQDTYRWQQNQGFGAFMVHEDSAPIDGSYDRLAIIKTLQYFKKRSYFLTYVFADFETGAWRENTLFMANAVLSSYPQAKVGNYGSFPGRYDLALAYPVTSVPELSANRTLLAGGNGLDDFYKSSKLKVAMPDAYAYSFYNVHSNDTWTWTSNWWNNSWNSSALTPNQRATIGKSYMSPNERAALFYAPLERVSLSRRELPSGHELIPYVSGLLNFADYWVQPSQQPTIADNRASVKHYRLRGASGFYAFDGASGVDYTLYRNSVLQAWKELDAFFKLPTTVGSVSSARILNLITNKNSGGTYVDPAGKNGGIEWSGYQRGNRILTLVSNLGNGNQSALWSLNSINPYLPSKSPSVLKGSHAIFQYLSNPTFDSFESSSPTRQLKGLEASAFIQRSSVVTNQGNKSALALTTNSTTKKHLWFLAAAPGGIYSTDAVDFGASIKVTGTIVTGGTMASYGPVRVVSSQPSTSLLVDPSLEGPDLSLVGVNSTQMALQIRSRRSSGYVFRANNFTVKKDNWYAFKITATGATNSASVWYKDLYKIHVTKTQPDVWTRLYFNNTSTSTNENLSTVPLSMTSAATTANFNGWQITGQKSQFDDLFIQLSNP